MLMTETMRHWGKGGRFEFSAYLPEADSDMGAKGYEEYPSRPPDPPRLWVWGGMAWVFRENPPQNKFEIVAALAALDTKKVRALTDALLLNDKTRLTALESDAAALRAKL